jgi:DNA modification methylase
MGFGAHLGADGVKARILIGDVRERLLELPDRSVQCVVTSPPYWGLRDYGHDGQIGQEKTPENYVAEMVAVFGEVRRVLADDGTLWLNLGDSYVGTGDKGDYQDPKHREGRSGQSKALNKNVDGLSGKNLVGIPWRVAFALQADGWWLRQDIIWAKPNPMPEPVKDRCTKSHEYVFLLTKSARYFYDADAIAEASTKLKVTNIRFGSNKYGDSDDPKHQSKSGKEYTDTGTRNKRSVWAISTKPYSGAHFAVMPTALAEPCILAGSRSGDIVLDPFAGSGTVGVVALRNDREFIGIEINPTYAELAESRIHNDGPLFNQVVVA